MTETETALAVIAVLALVLLMTVAGWFAGALVGHLIGQRQR